MQSYGGATREFIGRPDFGVIERTAPAGVFLQPLLVDPKKRVF